MLKGRHILIGITGSIAAYKSAMLIRLLVREGAVVKVVMTAMAKQFITPLTIATLSKNPISVDFYNPENGDWNSHISLGIWADLYLIAPASANTISKMATGTADNLLLTTYLSARSPVAVAPAMDMDMYMHNATQDNIETLRKRGVFIIEPAAGELASGLDGKGRMEEPENIVMKIRQIIAKRTDSENGEKKIKNTPYSSKKILITAGPTIEQIDPVRYISNHSSGKMGYAIAKEFASRGAKVLLISGPVNEKTDTAGLPGDIKVFRTISAKDMADKSEELYAQEVDIAIFAAAVSDYTPVSKHVSKIKKTSGMISLELKPTKDIAAAIGKIKRKGSIHIGFALETDHEEQHAKEKLKQKNFDAIILNSMNEKGAGFAGDTNKITIFPADGDPVAYELKSKAEVAKDIADYIEKTFLC